MTRPTHPVPAQLTAIRRLPPSAAWSTAALAVLGIGHVARPRSWRRARRPPVLAPSSLRSKIVHRTPRDVSLRAVPSPRPDAPPVMTAEMPLRSMRRMLRAAPRRPPKPGSGRAPRRGDRDQGRRRTRPAGPWRPPRRGGRPGRSWRHRNAPSPRRSAPARAGSSANSSSGSHRSRLATGLPAELRHPRRCHPSHHRSRKQFTT